MSKKKDFVMYKYDVDGRLVSMLVDKNDKKKYRIAIAVKEPSDKDNDEFVKGLLVSRLEKRRKNGSYLEIKKSKVLDFFMKSIAERSAKNAEKRALNKNYRYNDFATFLLLKEIFGL